MEDAIARLTDEQAEYAMTLRGDLFWQYIKEVERSEPTGSDGWATRSHDDGVNPYR